MRPCITILLSSIIFLVFSFSFLNCSDSKSTSYEGEKQEKGIIIDKRDGKKYGWVLLKDGKKWMTENLSYEMINSWCYQEDKTNCPKYGRLYTWNAAINACPEGWHIPSDDEWWNMFEHYGTAYNFSSPGQIENKNLDSGNDAFNQLKPSGGAGFNAQYSGFYISEGIFGDIDKYGYYWSSTAREIVHAWYYTFKLPGGFVSRNDCSIKEAYSCRCIQ